MAQELSKVTEQEEQKRQDELEKLAAPIPEDPFTETLRELKSVEGPIKLLNFMKPRNSGASLPTKLEGIFVQYPTREAFHAGANAIVERRLISEEIALETEAMLLPLYEALPKEPVAARSWLTKAMGIWKRS